MSATTNDKIVFYGYTYTTLGMIGILLAVPWILVLIGVLCQVAWQSLSRHGG